MESIKQSKTLICGTGILNRIDLIEKDDKIFGRMNIRVSKNNIVSFRVNQSKKTSGGKINPCYRALQTMMREYKDVTMVENIEDADIVSIQENKNFPNASFYSNISYDMKRQKVYDNPIKNLKLVTRKAKTNKKYMVFKSYGIYVEDIKNSLVKCRMIDYRGRATKFNFINNKDIKIEKDTVLDIVGTIKEGLDYGIPSCSYNIHKVRKSDLITKDDFYKAINKYDEYVDSLKDEESPF